MSLVLDGNVIESNLSTNAMGGTEMMRKRLLDNVNKKLLENTAIYFSRPRDILDHSDKIKIFYAHDLYSDPENNILKNSGWKFFDHFVFVSEWQRETYIQEFGIPYSKVSVIPNAIEKEYKETDKTSDTIRFIYHTTPHRGLELLYPIFLKLCETYSNLHLDVFSSFEIYGWAKRDEKFKPLFDKLKKHEKITYHGTQPNSVVLDALDKAHIFLYPCIWKETSCIALLEAIKSGCITIHPNYGALKETADGCSVVYNYNENISKHAETAFTLTSNILKFYNEDLRKEYTNSKLLAANSLQKNSISSYKYFWETLLRKLKNEKN